MNKSSKTYTFEIVNFEHVKVIISCFKNFVENVKSKQVLRF